MIILPILAVNHRRILSVRLGIKQWVSGLSPLVMLLAHVVAPLPSYALEFPATGDRGAPERTAGGGTRGGLCEGGDWMQQSIKALVPTNNVHTFVGDQASLWVHLLDGFEGKQAEIYVQDIRTQTAVYQEQMSLGEPYEASAAVDYSDYRTASEGGIIQVDIPALTAEGEPLLAVNQDYYWEFAIICNPNDRTQDYTVQGLMTRLALSNELSYSLANSPAEQQAELYAEAGIWQETLAITQSLKPINNQLWADLLDSVGLAALSETPLKECCSPDVQ
ncbi:MAG: DUF928 domain-containing protein [Cyanobacteria bacterium J06598_3]